MTKKSVSGIRIPSAKNDDQPASRGMLRLVRDELKSEIRTLDRKMDARFKGVDARFEAMDTKFTARFDEMKTDLIRMHVLLEEQHSNNRIVLDGLQALWQRQDRIEQLR